MTLQVDFYEHKDTYMAVNVVVVYHVNDILNHATWLKKQNVCK